MEWNSVRNTLRQFAADMQRERHGRDWGTQNRYDGGGRDRSYGGGGSERWNAREDYGYSPHNSSIGFNGEPRQQREYGSYASHGYSRHEGQQPEMDERTFKKHMEQYFRKVKEGEIEPSDELCEFIVLAAQECMGSGESRHGGHDEEEHEEYKEAIERLREAPANEKQKLMSELFGDDLEPDEKVVLKYMAEQKPYKRLAMEKGMTLERWKDARKSLKQVYKRNKR